MTISTHQLNNDRLLLTFWAGPDSYDIRHGYERIAKNYRISLKLAKKRVHEAIKRGGGNPHTSQGLVRAWMINRRRAANVTDLT